VRHALLREPSQLSMGAFALNDISLDAHDNRLRFVSQRHLVVRSQRRVPIRPGFLFFAVDEWLAGADDLAFILQRPLPSKGRTVRNSPSNSARSSMVLAISPRARSRSSS
jgi:hypothetical protein